MKYRIQVTVGVDRLPGIVEAAYRGKLDYDPELKVWPAEVKVEVPRAIPAPAKAKRRNGVRKVIVEEALKAGPKRWGELRNALKDAGLSETSLNSLISAWQKEGKISRSPEGLWRLVADETQAHA